MTNEVFGFVWGIGVSTPIHEEGYARGWKQNPKLSQRLKLRELTSSA